jgi:hypothetical protein
MYNSRLRRIFHPALYLLAVVSFVGTRGETPVEIKSGEVSQEGHSNGNELFVPPNVSGQPTNLAANGR